ncbi:hypothetical protein RchiOBHm_Chr6g0291751 [Rosa chinensis]|uniref:Uncharacterized protein n=1 Tax=Rosa chinensis TaxID=74649 RepID=A0A2P6PW77_ROSCH|nr:uncharacterized protein LOC112171589 [Rosa chinensis]PRQ26178.1 hypothetical protein RchiOBHm_Chr6g0291751 [Rosa chinensis]
MMKGLGICRTSEDLWNEYLRIETFLNKLKNQKVALREDDRTHTSADEKQWRDENKDLYTLLNQEREYSEGSDADNEKSINTVNKSQEQGLSILRTIYIEAVKALPSSFTLRKRLLEILEATSFVNSEEIRKKIPTDMKRDFPTEPEYWDWLARLEYNPASTQEMSEEITLSQVEKAVQVYELAIEVLPSAIIFNQYAKFFMHATALLKRENNLSGLASPSAALLVIFHVF